MRGSTDGVFQVPKAQVLAMIGRQAVSPTRKNVKKAQGYGISKVHGEPW